MLPLAFFRVPLRLAALFFAAAVPLAFLVGLVPFVGPPLATLWGAFALAFQLTDGPLTRRGRNFFEKLRWHREWRPEAPTNEIYYHQG